MIFMINAKWYHVASLVLEMCQVKICPEFLTSSYTNWALRPKKLSRDLLFQIREFEGLNY